MTDMSIKFGSRHRLISYSRMHTSCISSYRLFNPTLLVSYSKHLAQNSIIRSFPIRRLLLHAQCPSRVRRLLLGSLLILTPAIAFLVRLFLHFTRPYAAPSTSRNTTSAPTSSQNLLHPSSMRFDLQSCWIDLIWGVRSVGVESEGGRVVCGG